MRRNSRSVTRIIDDIPMSDLDALPISGSAFPKSKSVEGLYALEGGGSEGNYGDVNNA